MAVTVANLSSEPRSFSLGPIKCQIVEITAASGDTSIVITADKLTTVQAVIIDTVIKTAESLSGNTATITIADPLASVVATAMVLGR